jgi:hypothetical protein
VLPEIDLGYPYTKAGNRGESVTPTIDLDMKILDELKRESERLRNDQQQASGGTTGLQDYHSLSLVNGLMEIHAYLHDLIAQLNMVRPDVRHDYQISDFGAMKDLQQGDYKLLCESTYHKESVCIQYSLQNDDKLEFEVKSRKDDTNGLESLKNQGLLANFAPNTADKIVIQGFVPVRLDFESQFEDSTIIITTRNLHKLGAHRYMLSPEVIDEDLLDELGKLILSRENRFFDRLNEQSLGSLSINRSETSLIDDTPHTEEMEISRLRSLFNREQHVYLTYHNVIKDVGSRTQGFILGRAKDSDLVINSDLASRHHARLLFRKGKFVLIDQSTNGTFIKPQGGKEVYVQSEELPLSGSGFISLGKAITVDNDHLIYYSCQ